MQSLKLGKLRKITKLKAATGPLHLVECTVSPFMHIILLSHFQPTEPNHTVSEV